MRHLQRCAAETMTSFSSFSPQLWMVESALPWHNLDGACTHERPFPFPKLCAGRIKEGASAARTQPHPTRNYPMETALSCSWPLPQPECREEAPAMATA